MDETLGANLARMRHERGMTQAGLSDKAGLARETVSRIEAGTTYPRTDTVMKLCRALGCRPDELYGFAYDGGRHDG